MVNDEKAMTVAEIRAGINKLKKLLNKGQISEHEYDKQLEYYSKLQKGGLSQQEYENILQKIYAIDLVTEKEAGVKKKKNTQPLPRSDPKFSAGCLILAIGVFFYILGGLFTLLLEIDISDVEDLENYFNLLHLIYIALLFAPVFCFSGIGLMIIGFRNEWKNSLILKK